MKNIIKIDGVLEFETLVIKLSSYLKLCIIRNKIKNLKHFKCHHFK